MTFAPLASDFYSYAARLTDRERTALADLRAWLERDVRPIVNDHWERAEFPMQVVAPLAEASWYGISTPC
jgi:glutaryl-CoA dehydrogenase